MIKIFHVTSFLGLLAALAACLIICKDETSFQLEKTIRRQSNIVFDLLKTPESLLLTTQTFKKIVLHSILEDTAKTLRIHFSALEYFQHVDLQNVTALLVADMDSNKVSITYLAFKGIVNIHSSYEVFNHEKSTELKVQCSLKVPWILKRFLYRRYIENYNETLNTLEEVV